MADVDQGAATALLGAGGRLVRTLGALLDAMFLLRGHSILHAPRTLVKQNDTRLIVRLGDVTFLVTGILVVVDTQLI